MNGFYKILFKGNNFYVDLFNIPEQYKDYYITLKTTSACGKISMEHFLNAYRWYSLAPTGVFKYDTSISVLTENGLEVIDSLKFDARNHIFKLSLYPRNNKELILWIQYINLLESIYDINIEYVVDQEIEIDYYDRTDTVKISFDEYARIAAHQNKVIDPNCSSYEIIKNIFNIIDL